MEERIDEKIVQIEDYLKNLSEIKPVKLDDYVRDIMQKAACERFAQKIIEAVIDLAYLIVRMKQWQSPEDEEHVFDILFNQKIISSGLMERLKNAKRMRNFIVHEYGEIDDEIVFNAVKDELEGDVIAEQLNFLGGFNCSANSKPNEKN